jgi:hypothetical protein
VTISSWDRFVCTSGLRCPWKVCKEMMWLLMFLDCWASNHHLKHLRKGLGAGGSDSQSRRSRSAHLPVGGMWALIIIAHCRMQIAMSLLMGGAIAQWLGSMGSTVAGGGGALAMVDDKVEWGR